MRARVDLHFVSHCRYLSACLEAGSVSWWDKTVAHDIIMELFRKRLDRGPSKRLQARRFAGSVHPHIHQTLFCTHAVTAMTIFDVTRRQQPRFEHLARRREAGPVFCQVMFYRKANGQDRLITGTGMWLLGRRTERVLPVPCDCFETRLGSIAMDMFVLRQKVKGAILHLRVIKRDARHCFRRPRTHMASTILQEAITRLGCQIVSAACCKEKSRDFN